MNEGNASSRSVQYSHFMREGVAKNYGIVFAVRVV